MGNTNQTPSNATQDDDPTLFPPPRKRARGIRGSWSLRSIASLASGRFSSRSSNDAKHEDHGQNEEVRRKRKHTDPPAVPTISGSLMSTERYWPALVETGFEPQFPWRSDVCESDFIVLNLIGSGRFGAVFRALPRISSEVQVAIKIQDKVQILKAGAEEQIRNEVYVQKLLGNNRFVAELFECWQTSRELFSVMEYVDGYGDLFTFCMLWSEYGQFSEELTRLYGAEIAFGLEYLHDQHVIHRDLKMENLALDVNLHVKFVDFGFSKLLSPGEHAKTICGTLQYMAPEIAHGQSYGLPVDWWAFGVVLHIMRTACYPFPNGYATTHEELVFDAQPHSDTCSQEFRVLIEQLLLIDPAQRISTAADLFAQPFYENVNIEGIFNQDVPPWEILKSEPKYAEVQQFKTPDGSMNSFHNLLDF